MDTHQLAVTACQLFSDTGTASMRIKLFSELDPGLQAHLAAVFPIQTDEIPLVGGKWPEALPVRLGIKRVWHLLLVSNKKVYWTSNEEVTCMRLDSIKSISEELSANPKFQKRGYHGVFRLTLRMADGSTMLMPVKGGGAVCSLLPMLRYLSR